jgi:hypothetical protein
MYYVIYLEILSQLLYYLSIYYYKEMGVSGLKRLFMMCWRPPSPPFSLEGPAKVNGWWDG